MTTPDDEQAENSPDQAELAQQIDAIVARGPGGAFAVAGVATAIVVGLFYLFYLLVYLPRGVVQ